MTFSFMLSIEISSINKAYKFLLREVKRKDGEIIKMKGVKSRSDYEYSKSFNKVPTSKNIKYFNETTVIY